jgi:hypothetical protein
MKKERIRKVLLVLLGLLLFSIGYYIFYKITNIGIPCVFHTVFGLYCPGCGITRMIFSIMQLDFYQAFRYNALMFIFTPFIIFFAGDLIIAYLYDRKTKFFGKVPNFVWIILTIICVIFGAIRNMEPFTYLEPTDIRSESKK